MQEQILSDSLFMLNEVQKDLIIQQSGNISCWNYIRDISTLIIALVNLLLVLYVYLNNKNDNNKNNDKNRKIGLFKTLILDHNMGLFYSFFNNLVSVCKPLLESGDQANKTQVEDKITDCIIAFRPVFIDSLLAIDNDLYNKFIEEIDDLQGCLSTAIFDGGINLTNEPKYNELIESKIAAVKTNLIKILFSYQG